MEWGGIYQRCAFEIFQSGGAWSFLLGKPMLARFNALHDYTPGCDHIYVRSGAKCQLLTNQLGRTPDTSDGVNVTLDIKDVRWATGNTEEPVWYIGPNAPPNVDTDDPGEEVPDMFPEGDRTLYTRRTDPFKPQRVEAVLDAIRIGDDLTPEQRQQVRNLVTEYADCFALSVSEVIPVPGAIHRLNVPENATFSRKVRQKTLSPPQKAYLHKKIDEMLDAGVIAPCHPSEVKCVSPITLAKKAHDNEGLTLQELQYRVEEQCRAAGLPPSPEPIPIPPQRSEAAQKTPSEPKWRICQNFGQVNKVTEIAPMPQGNIRAKQLNLSGRRWVSVVDFASGFYAVTVAEESRPYTAFYVEGRGYFWCVRMPFGLTGAPSTFAQLTAERLHDLLSDGTIELFVDDAGAADDDFNSLLEKMRRVFHRVRERHLSLSAAKAQLFMTDTVFAGSTVGTDGVRPDLTKLTAIVDWRQPPHALNLASFLGVTSYFRDLIRDYAKHEGPLRDLLKQAEPPKGASKAVYRRALQQFALDETRWKMAHTAAFLLLKKKLTSEPVLRRPLWDGTPFIVTSDGCKDGFGAVLAQRSNTVLTNGEMVKRVHPIAYASKRTSRSEERYKPFLLEFAALKYALDKFGDTIWGYPVEVETDCSALRYALTNDKLNDTHARWRDGVLAHQIVDVRHIPGKTNLVGDGLSRQGEGLSKERGDGSEWTVGEDWEESRGLVNDMFAIEIDTTPQQRFAKSPLFLQVVNALEDIDDPGVPERAKQRAKHRAAQYMLVDGRLWRLRGGAAGRPASRVECVNSDEAKALAAEQHTTGGHYGRDAVKIALLDKITCPGLDTIILDTIAECGHCKHFGAPHLHALMDPITRQQPFQLLVGDYLSLPNGKGGFHTVGVYADVFAQRCWAFKFKTAGSAKTTIQSLRTIFTLFREFNTFMSDGGSHFNNQEVREFCSQNGTKTHVVAAYSPWINGLVENLNKQLQHVLKRLCAPDLDADPHAQAKPGAWPDHLDEAVRILNNRTLPGLRHSPNELLFGLPRYAAPNGPLMLTAPPTETDAHIHMMFADQARVDGGAAAAAHGNTRKAAFDKRVRKSRAGQVIFAVGDLVQILRSDLDYTFKTERKLLSKWSSPIRITGSTGNSYTLADLAGTSIAGRFSARRLRHFYPKPGSGLAAMQGEFLANLRQATDSVEQSRAAPEQSSRN